TPIKFPFRSFNIRHTHIFSLPIENDLATIGISIGDPAPRTYGVAVLLRGIHFDRNRTFIIFIQKILYRVDIMLPHITQSTAVVIPVSSKCSMYAVVAIGLIGGRPQPHLVV